MARDLWITKVPFFKQIIIAELNRYLKEEVYTDGLFGENFQNIRVSEDHPFAKLIASQLGLEDTPTYSETDLFPSITLVTTSEGYASDRSVLEHVSLANVGQAELDHMVENRKLMYIMSTDDIARIQTAFDALPEGSNYIQFEGMEQSRSAEITLEIWTQNSTVKDRLFDLMSAFLVGFGRLNLRENYSIVVDNDSVTGERDGIYNYDFNYRLAGAMIRFKIDYNIGHYRSPETVVIGQEVIVTDCQEASS